MKTFMDLAQARESCREFTDEKVSDQQLLDLVEAARIAPSARNSQPWDVLLVNDNEKAAALIPGLQDHGINGFLQENLGYIILIEKDLDPDHQGMDSRKQRYAQLDIGIATAHIVLRATEKGLGTCIIGALIHPILKDVLPIKSRFGTAIAIAVGYPKKDTIRPKKRHSLEDISRFVK